MLHLRWLYCLHFNFGGVKATSAEKNDKHSGNIRKREDGRYEGRICINNRRKSVYGNTEAEVKRKIREYRNKIATGFVEPKKVTLNEYIEYWL